MTCQSRSYDYIIGKALTNYFSELAVAAETGFWRLRITVEDESDLDYPIFSLFYFRYEAVWFEVNEENCLPVLITTVVAEILQPLDEFPAEFPVEFLQGVVAGYGSLAYFWDYVG